MPHFDSHPENNPGLSSSEIIEPSAGHDEIKADGYCDEVRADEAPCCPPVHPEVTSTVDSFVTTNENPLTLLADTAAQDWADSDQIAADFAAGRSEHTLRVFASASRFARACAQQPEMAADLQEFGEIKARKGSRPYLKVMKYLEGRSRGVAGGKGPPKRSSKPTMFAATLHLADREGVPDSELGSWLESKGGIAAAYSMASERRPIDHTDRRKPPRQATPLKSGGEMVASPPLGGLHPGLGTTIIAIFRSTEATDATLAALSAMPGFVRFLEGDSLTEHEVKNLSGSSLQVSEEVEPVSGEEAQVTVGLPCRDMMEPVTPVGLVAETTTPIPAAPTTDTPLNPVSAADEPAPPAVADDSVPEESDAPVIAEASPVTDSLPNDHAVTATFDGEPKEHPKALEKAGFVKTVLDNGRTEWTGRIEAHRIPNLRTYVASLGGTVEFSP